MVIKHTALRPHIEAVFAYNAISCFNITISVAVEGSRGPSFCHYCLGSECPVGRGKRVLSGDLRAMVIVNENRCVFITMYIVSKVYILQMYTSIRYPDESIRLKRH